MCEGSLLNIGTKKGKKLLAFCNAADTLQRNNLTLRISFDEGLSWKANILIDRTDNKRNDYTAYSDLVLINKSNIGVLYEKDNYKTILFTQLQFSRRQPDVICQSLSHYFLNTNIFYRF